MCFFKAFKNTATAVFLLASIFSAVAMDRDDVSPEQHKKIILKEKLKTAGIDIKYTRNLYKELRASGNDASDKDLIGYILRDHNWQTFSSEQQDLVIDKIKKVGDIRPSVEANAMSTFTYLRGVGNNTSNEELLKFCLQQHGYNKWDRLSPETKQRLIAKTSASSSSSSSSSFNVLLLTPEDFEKHFREKQRLLLEKANAGDMLSQKEIVALFRQGLWGFERDTFPIRRQQQVPGFSLWENIENLACEDDDYALVMLGAVDSEEATGPNSIRKKIFPRVFEAIKQRAQQGFAGAQYNAIVADNCGLDEHKRKIKEICELLAKNAEKGHDLSQEALAHKYQVSFAGVEENIEKRYALLTQAANQQLTSAEFHLGKYYRTVAGSYDDIMSLIYPDEETISPLDFPPIQQKREAYEQAMHWFIKAAQKGHAEAHQLYYDMANEQINLLRLIRDNFPEKLTQEQYKTLATQEEYINNYRLHNPM